MSFWVEPATAAVAGKKPAGFDGGAVLSGSVSVPTATLPPTVTSPDATGGDGPWLQMCSLWQAGAVRGGLSALLPPPAPIAATRQVLATPDAGTVNVNDPFAAAVVRATLPGIGPVI